MTIFKTHKASDFRIGDEIVLGLVVPFETGPRFVPCQHNDGPYPHRGQITKIGRTRVSITSIDDDLSVQAYRCFFVDEAKAMYRASLASIDAPEKYVDAL